MAKPETRNQKPGTDPALLVVFGSRGDLARRKLLPALYNLSAERLLPRHFAVLALGRKPFTEDQFHDDVFHDLEEHSRQQPRENVWARFRKHLCYTQGNFDVPETYEELKREMAAMDRRFGTRGNRVFYLAVPPDIAPVLVKHLAAAGLITPPGAAPWTRVVFEKPFGLDRSRFRLRRC